MPLKLNVPNLNDVPEALRAAYRSRTEGPGFTLDVDGDVVPKATYDETRRRLERVVIDQEVARAAVELGAHATAVDDIAMRVRQRFKVGDDGKAYATDAQGNRIFGEDGQPLGVAGAVRQLTSTAPHLFRPAAERAANGGGGSRVNVSTNPWARVTWNVTEQGRILKADRAEAERLALEAGKKL